MLNKPHYRGSGQYSLCRTSAQLATHWQLLLANFKVLEAAVTYLDNVRCYAYVRGCTWAPKYKHDVLQPPVLGWTSERETRIRQVQMKQVRITLSNQHDSPTNVTTVPMAQQGQLNAGQPSLWKGPFNDTVSLLQYCDCNLANTDKIVHKT